MAARYIQHDPILRGHYHPEDLASDALVQIIQQIARGRLLNIDSFEHFWIICRNVSRQAISAERKRVAAIKRGGQGNDVTAEGLRPVKIIRNRPITESIPDDLDVLPSDVARPDRLTEGAEVIERLLSLLKPEMRTIAELKLNDYSVQEIAVATRRPPRTIERRLQTIRRIWDNSGLIDRTETRRCRSRG